MSLTKITISGEVLKNPEKRYTDNNLAICAFPLDFSLEGQQEKQVNVFTIGGLADRICDTVKKGQTVIVEGRLQTTTKTENGTEKKYTEINAQGIEIIEKSSGSYQSSDGSYQSDPISSPESEVNSEDLIGEEEIPF